MVKLKWNFMRLFNPFQLVQKFLQHVRENCLFLFVWGWYKYDSFFLYFLDHLFFYFNQFWEGNPVIYNFYVLLDYAYYIF
jgi:hypothetical protein